MNMLSCKPVKKLWMSGLWCYLEVHFSLVGLESPDAFAVILHLYFILMHVYQISRNYFDTRDLHQSYEAARCYLFFCFFRPTSLQYGCAVDLRHVVCV
jgi:hypothetical protein